MSIYRYLVHSSRLGFYNIGFRFALLDVAGRADGAKTFVRKMIKLIEFVRRKIFYNIVLFWVNILPFMPWSPHHLNSRRSKRFESRPGICNKLGKPY
jgi:hypothetical protein